MGPFTNSEVRGDDVINRGYQARTSECFAYNTDKSQWYVWKDPSLDDTEDESGSNDETSARLVEIPNSRDYGYDRYLTLNSYNYDGVLSISPVGTSHRCMITDMKTLLQHRYDSQHTILFNRYG